MAKGEIQIKGDLTAAMQSFVNSVTYMGGSVTSMNPSRPVEFNVRRAAGMMGGVGAPYGGTATFVPTTNGMTRVLIELKPKAWYTAMFVLVALAAVALVGSVGGGEDDPTLVGIAAIVMLSTAATLYLYYVPWQQKVIEKLQMGVHGAVSAFDMPATAHGGAAAFVSPEAPPVAPVPAQGTSIGDQLRQLAELHQQKLITDGEFEAKKAELLKRL